MNGRQKLQVIWFTGISILICIASADASGQVPANTPVLDTSGTTRRDSTAFKALFLGQEQEPVRLNAIWGKFERLITLDGYLKAYALKCSQFLPEDKVELTFRTCKKTAQDERGDIECVEPDEIHTHLYTDRNLDELRKEAATEAAEGKAAEIRIAPNAYERVQEMWD
jgi:hypothetical protein